MTTILSTPEAERAQQPADEAADADRIIARMKAFAGPDDPFGLEG